MHYVERNLVYAHDGDVLLTVHDAEQCSSCIWCKRRSTRVRFGAEGDKKSYKVGVMFMIESHNAHDESLLVHIRKYCTRAPPAAAQSR